MPSLDEYRARYDDLRSLSDADAIQQIAKVNGVDVGDVTSYLNYEPPGGDFLRQLKNSWTQTKQLGAGLGAAAAATAETSFGEGGLATGLKKAAVEKYKEIGNELQINSKASDSLSYSWEEAHKGNFGALVDWTQGAFGMGISQIGQAIGTAGVGGIIGRTVGKKVVEGALSEMVEKEAKRLVLNNVAEDEAKKQAVGNVASRIGQNAAIGAQVLGMEGGEIGGDLAARATEEGRILTGAEIARALAATVVAAGPEAITERWALDAMTGKLPWLKAMEEASGVKGKTARAGMIGAAGATIGAGQEFTQTYIEEAGKGNEINDQTLRMAIDAAGMGAVGGAIPGVVGGLVTRPNEPAAQAPSEEAPPNRQVTLAEIEQMRTQRLAQLDQEERGHEGGVVTNPEGGIDVIAPRIGRELSPQEKGERLFLTTRPPEAIARRYGLEIAKPDDAEIAAPIIAAQDEDQAIAEFEKAATANVPAIESQKVDILGDAGREAEQALPNITVPELAPVDIEQPAVAQALAVPEPLAVEGVSAPQAQDVAAEDAPKTAMQIAFERAQQRSASTGPVVATDQAQAAQPAAIAVAAPQTTQQTVQQAATQEAPQPAPIEQRNPTRQERIAQMTPADIEQELYVSRATGIKNRRALDEDMQEGKKAVTFIDLDGLKYINDTFGHEKGNELLKKFADAMKSAGIDGYHVSGDEFAILSDNMVEAKKAIKALEAEAKKARIDSDTDILQGITFSYGMSKDLATADANMQKMKASREQAGLRVRGGRPPNLVSISSQPAPQPQRSRSVLPTAEDVAPRDAVPATQMTATSEISREVTSRPTGRKATATTPAGRSVDVEYRIVEAGSLVASNDESGGVNQQYPAELQPRDRSRAAATAQVDAMSRQINPALLGDSPTTTDGAPIVAPDGVVESGNGRTLALRRAYRHGRGESYRKWLSDQGYDVEGMAEPVLVRVRRTQMTPSERVAYARESNERTTLEMSATEQAATDAEMIRPILSEYHGGDVASAANAGFARKFVAGLSGQGARGGMMDSQGLLSQGGRRRIEAALLSSAYGDPELVADVFESADTEIKAIGGALLDAAGRWAMMREAVRAGATADGLDVTQHLIDAVNLVRRARSEGRRLSEVVGTDDILSGRIDPMTEAFLRIFYRTDPSGALGRARGREKVADALTYYADQSLQSQPGEGLLGDPLTAEMLIGGIDERLRGQEQPAGSADLFAAGRADNEQDARAAGEARRRPGAGAEGRPDVGAAQRGERGAESQEGFSLAGQTEAERVAEEARKKAEEVAAAREEDAKAVDQPAQDDRFYYTTGLLGMTSSGSFTEDKSRWVTFPRDEAQSFDERNLKPAYATKRGIFTGVTTGRKLAPKPKPVTPQVREVAGSNEDSKNERNASTVQGYGGVARSVSEPTETGARQFDLFAEPGESKRKAYADLYGTVVKAKTVSHIKASVDHISSDSDLASLLASIRKDAQESLYAVVTDKSGQILRVMRHTKGLKAGSSVSPVTIISEAAGIPGASKIYMAHNHPSGNPRPSLDDVKITDFVERSLSGTGMSIGGHVVIGKSTWAPVGGNSSFEFKPGLRTKRIPITERTMTKRDTLGEALVNPEIVRQFVAGLDNAIVLLNIKHQPVGIVNMTADEMTNLRGNSGEGAKRILAALDKSNAYAIIVKTNDRPSAKNITNFVRHFNESSEFKLLDWIDGEGVSAAESNRLDFFETAPYFSGTKEGVAESTINVDGIERPTTNSEGQRIHPTEDGIRNFWEWFGDSRVVDDQGRPLVVYHGTGADFSEFSFDKTYTGEEGSQSGSGFYFTTDPESASGYASGASNKGLSGRVLPTYLSIKNPLHIDFGIGEVSGAEIKLSRKQVRKIILSHSDIRTVDESPLYDFGDIEHEGFEKVLQAAVDLYAGGNNIAALRNDIFRHDENAWLKALSGATGHDGVVSYTPGATHWVAWSPEQIKSATGNTGEFSRSDARIHKSAGEGRQGEHTVASVTSDIEAKLGKGAISKIADQFRIVPDMAALKADMEARGSKFVELVASKEGFLTKGLYDPSTDTSYIVAGNLGAEDSPYGIFLHEVGEHYGLEKMLGQEAYAGVLNQAQMILRAGGKAMREAAVRVNASENVGLDPDAKNFHRLFADKMAGNKRLSREVIAYLADNPKNHDMPFMRRIMVAVREFMRKLGFTKPLTTDDIVSLITTAARRSGEFSQRRGEASTETIKFGGAARPTTNSEGQPIHPTEEGLRNFWRWFGDSKAVDDQGRPLVVYHGAQKGGFDQFKKVADDWFTSGHATAPLGYWLSESYKVANEFAVPRTGIRIPSEATPAVYVAHLSIQNPKVYEEFSDLMAATRKAGSARQLRGQLERAGHDGIEITRSTTDLVGERRDYIAFRPEQIKSALGNQGSYDPSDPSILRSSGQRTAAQAIAQQTLFSRKNLDEAGSLVGSKFTLPAETFAQKAQRYAQDEANRFQVVQDAVVKQGGKVDESSNIADAIKRYPGRLAAAMKDTTETLVEPFAKRIHDAGTTTDGVSLLAYAEHAPERNAEIAKINPRFPNDGTPGKSGSGMTDQEAADIIKQVKAMPNAAEMFRLSQELRDITDQNLDNLVAGGEMEQSQADEYRKRYKFYVPLKGFELVDESGMTQPTGKGLSTGSKLGFRAMGRESRAGQIFEHVIQDYENGLMLSEKAVVAKTLRNFIKANPDDALWTIDNAPKKPRLEKGGSLYQIIAGGNLIAETASKEYADKQVQALLPTDPTAYVAEVKPSPKGLVKWRDSPFDPEEEIRFIENGKPVRIQLSDAGMVRSYNRLWHAGVSDGLRLLNSYNTWLRQMYTQKNPAWFFMNAQKDVLSVMPYVTGEAGIKTALKIPGNIPGAFKAAWAFHHGKTAGAKWNALIEQFKATGGYTGFAFVGDIEAQTDRLNGAIARHTGWDEAIGKFRTKGAKAGISAIGAKVMNTAFFSWIEAMNSTFENMTRLAVFKSALDSGMTPNEAGKLAKNASTNFNTRGEWGPNINAVWLFANAGIQGTRNVGHALMFSPHKEQVWALMGGLVALGVMTGLMSDDDDDLLDDQIRSKSLVFKVGDTQLSLPMPYGFGFFSGFGQLAAQAMKHPEKRDNIALKMATLAFDHFSPVGDPLSGEADLKNVVNIAPTSIRPVLNVAANVSPFGGGPLFPESPYDETKPDSTKMWTATRGTGYDNTAKWLNALTGGDQYKAGAISVSPETLKLSVSTLFGGAGKLASDILSLPFDVANETLAPSKVPILKNYVREIDQKAYLGRFYQQAQEAQDAYTIWRRYLKAGMVDEATSYKQGEAAMISMGGMVSSYRKQIKTLRDLESMTVNSDLSSTEKNLRLAKTNAAIVQITTAFDERLKDFR